jgi:23S rRNA (guanosine2251-2'-O)-methyltransferase
VSRIVYGLNPVIEALRMRRARVVYVGEGVRALADLRGQAQAAGAALEVKPVREIETMAGAGAHHQGVVAVADDFRYAEVEEVLAGAEQRRELPLVLVLDGLQDPANLGALIRSAHVLGAHGVIVPKDRAVAVTPAVVRVAAGATEHLPIARATNLARTVEGLKQSGLWVVGAVTEGGRPPWEVDFRVPSALVLGAEGKGIRPLVARGCDVLVEVPMAGEVGSLNVAAAGAALLYEASRQRRTMARRA